MATPKKKPGKLRLGKASGRALNAFANGFMLLSGHSGRREVGNAPKEIIFRAGKLEVSHLTPEDGVTLGWEESDQKPLIPLLVIPPLMVRPFVYDLRPEHSMLRFLRDRGFDVYLVDFGVPDHVDEGLRLDDYVTRFIPQAVDAVCKHSKSENVTLVGYCMGGIFALLQVATYSDPRVAHIVAIGAPVDFDQMGVLTLAARMGGPLVDPVLDRLGNVPGKLSAAGFKLMGGIKTITRYADLFAHLYNEEYVRGFDSIDTWLREMIPYPKEAFRQLVKEVVTGNKLFKNGLVFHSEAGEHPADLSNVTCPLLAFAGKTDNIATPASTRAILDVVGSKDKTYYEVSGGHVGVVAGSKAKQEVWSVTVEWLLARQG